MRTRQNFTYAGMVLACVLMAGFQPDGHADMLVAATRLDLAQLLAAPGTPWADAEPEPVKGLSESPVRH